MPKLKCPTSEEVNESIESMWRHVGDDYVTSHIEACKWSYKSIEASKRYSGDAKKRAKAILKWISFQCQKRGLHQFVSSVHLIDHSVKPPQVAPYIICSLSKPGFEWCRLELKFYAPKEFADIENKFLAAADVLSKIADVEGGHGL